MFIFFYKSSFIQVPFYRISVGHFYSLYFLFDAGDLVQHMVCDITPSLTVGNSVYNTYMPRNILTWSLQPHLKFFILKESSIRSKIMLTLPMMVIIASSTQCNHKSDTNWQNKCT